MLQLRQKKKKKKFLPTKLWLFMHVVFRCIWIHFLNFFNFQISLPSVSEFWIKFDWIHPFIQQIFTTLRLPFVPATELGDGKRKASKHNWSCLQALTSQWTPVNSEFQEDQGPTEKINTRNQEGPSPDSPGVSGKFYRGNNIKLKHQGWQEFIQVDNRGKNVLIRTRHSFKIPEMRDMFQKLQLCSNGDWGQWEWGGRCGRCSHFKGGKQERSCKESHKSY